MKKIIISVCMLIMLSLLFSELVPQATILEVATKWMNYKHSNLALLITMLRYRMRATPYTT